MCQAIQNTATRMCMAIVPSRRDASTTRQHLLGRVMNDNKPDTTAASILGFPRAAVGARAKAQAMQQQQMLLNTVLSNMSQGVLMFDADARLVFCNQRYIEMYGLSPDVVVPGCGVRELLEHRKAVGAFSGELENYIVDLR